MKLEEILLKKEELPVFRYAEYVFFMPIHPELLRTDIKIETHTSDVFEQAVEETKNEAGSCRNNYYDISLLDNGFANELFLNPHVGIFVAPYERYILPPQYVKFNERKLAEYSQESKKADCILENKPPFGYTMKNTTSETDAILLRNWLILYLNKAMKEVFGK